MTTFTGRVATLMGAQKSRVIVLVLGAMAVAAPSHASTIQFDFSSVFNADVIMSRDLSSPTGLDPDVQPADEPLGTTHLGFSFITQSAAALMFPSAPDGLPDNGFFAATGSHPDVQLGYSDSVDANNVRLSNNGHADSYTVSVPSMNYSLIDVFAMSGSGPSIMDVTLNYSDGSTSGATFSVPDWFLGPPVGGFVLVGGLDRYRLFDNGYEDSGGAQIFGFVLAPDPARTLTSLTITRDGNLVTGNVGDLDVFGATGVTADTSPSPVPEPATLLLLGTGLTGVGARRWRNRPPRR